MGDRRRGGMNTDRSPWQDHPGLILKWHRICPSPSPRRLPAVGAMTVPYEKKERQNGANEE